MQRLNFLILLILLANLLSGCGNGDLPFSPDDPNDLSTFKIKADLLDVRGYYFASKYTTSINNGDISMIIVWVKVENQGWEEIILPSSACKFTMRYLRDDQLFADIETYCYLEQIPPPTGDFTYQTFNDSLPRVPYYRIQPHSSVRLAILFQEYMDEIETLQDIGAKRVLTLKTWGRTTQEFQIDDILRMNLTTYYPST